jgi:DNA-binding CsgD family transcriptional regulator
MPQHKAIPFPAPSTRRVTPRQAQCLELAHLSNADIAAILGISAETVKAHLADAYARLGADNRTHAVMLLGRVA